MHCMKKSEAIELLGGTVTSAARAIGISPAAVSVWPDELRPRVADRVQAALWRIAQGVHQQAAPAAEPADQEGRITDPGVRKIQRLADYFTERPLASNNAAPAVAERADAPAVAEKGEVSHG